MVADGLILLVRLKAFYVGNVVGIVDPANETLVFEGSHALRHRNAIRIDEIRQQLVAERKRDELSSFEVFSISVRELKDGVADPLNDGFVFPIAVELFYRKHFSCGNAGRILGNFFISFEKV